PPRPAAKRLAHGHELGPPARVRPEVPCQCLLYLRAGLALISKPVKEQLMQNHGIHGDELLALEAVDEEAGGIGVIELGELLIDEVEPFHRSPIIVLV